MPSWRPQGSILEAPGLDFGGSGLDFPRFWTSQTMPENLSGWQTLCHRLVLHRWGVRGRKVVEILPSHRTSASNACASVSWRRWARCSRSGVAGGVPPLGAFNPPATEGVPTACQTHFQLALYNHSWPISTFFRVVRSRNSI